MPRTFTRYGDEYPDDGPFAQMMSAYFPPPDDRYSKEQWDLYRDWAKSRRIKKQDMEDLLLAYDSGDLNVVLRGRARSPKDLDLIMARLNPSRKASSSRVAERYLSMRPTDTAT